MRFRLRPLWLSLSFLAAGCDARPSGTDALLDAIGRSSVAKVTKALDEGADPNRKNWDGVLPLAAAARARSVAITELLISRRADPNAKESGASPLYFAVLFECEACAEVIADHGGKFAADSGQEAFLKRAISPDKFESLARYMHLR